ncbi:MAG: family 1 glycosylhydrolase [Pseudomonadota bacterium]
MTITFFSQPTQEILPTVVVTNKDKLPPLLLGFANCGYQSWGRKGGGESNWTRAADNGTVPEPGYSYNHYDNYLADLDIMQAAGANSYRISLDWADFQNAQGQWNGKTITFYKELFAACKARDIKPMVTLLHFTEPAWFSDLGGFEKEGNIRHFVAFAERMFEFYGDEVETWCTINEANIQAFCGYLKGEFPPHKHSLQLMLDVLLNLLKAHVAVFTALKKMPGGDKAQIGFVHNLLKFIPRFAYEPLEVGTATFMTGLMNDLVMNFFKTGKFDYEIPLVASKHDFVPDAVNSLDFIGLNFYANAVIGFNPENGFGPTYFPGQKKGELHLTVDPKGFAAAIDECATLNKPVIVTEYGVADTSDKLRVELLETCLPIIDKKRAAGVKLIGFHEWSIKSNYEWAHGYTQRFGMYHLDGTPMESALIYEEYMKNTLHGEKAEAKRDNVLSIECKM